MVQLGSDLVDLTPLLAWVLLLCRFSGIFFAIPGIGTEEVPPTFRLFGAVSISAALMFTGATAPQPAHLGELLLMIGSELTLGYLIGSMPAFVLGGLAVAGQVIAGAIGLGQANMIDRSLGANVSVLARLDMMVATAVFLAIDGHHAILRSACGVPGELGLGLWRADAGTAQLLTSQLVSSFELALRVSAPILVTTLVTQFVLGLITKFVPQVNIFIISLPLSVIVGLYLMAYTFDGVARHTMHEFEQTEELVGRLYPTLVRPQTQPTAPLQP
ncbi:MAG: flagellar biosynthetic protein FliR [Bdellovibrionales bacterium]|nr:flagellar biosynthetic protein FliR [Bdellovibrionales bacterium]